MDFILNGSASGYVAQALLKTNGDMGALRPWKDPLTGRSYMTLNENGKPVSVPISNAEATLRKDDWIQLDTAIVKAAKQRLRFVSDLRSAGLQYSLTNGVGKTVLQTQTQSDITPAQVDMDGRSRGQKDRPKFDIVNLPLPIVHKGFSFGLRELMASRNGGSPLDTTTAELAARQVAEGIENLAIGNLDDYAFGGGTVYGLLNFPHNTGQTLTSPETTGWTPATILTEVLSMRQKARLKMHYGPYRLYVGSGWDPYLDEDYSAQKGTDTVRERLKKIDGIQDVVSLDYLSGYNMFLVQMTSDVVRMVVGMEITTVQWESEGGMEQNFKVMAIQTPQLRADINGNSGIVHGAVAP